MNGNNFVGKELNFHIFMLLHSSNANYLALYSKLLNLTGLEFFYLSNEFDKLFFHLITILRIVSFPSPLNHNLNLSI